MNSTQQLQIARALRELYLDDGAFHWLISPQPLLDGAIPAQMMAAGNGDKVLAVVNDIASDTPTQFQ